MNEIHKCKRCNRILTSVESIKRGYGNKCFLIIQLQKDQDNDHNHNEIQFLKCEIKFLKRQLQELKQNSFAIGNIESIERIKQDNHRPERNEYKVQFNILVKELKIIFNNENFDYHNVLKPIETRNIPEDPPLILESVELLN